jgi:hypothetical protein
MNRHIILGIFFLFSICLLFAFVTDHRWEDWYITFRASKNFALGNGLVFNIGEKMMTYTSPIGTLFPALIKFIFINQSDDFTIWIYRVVCALTLSSTSYFIFKIIKQLNYPTFYYYFALFLFAFSFLIIDNTINGMESAFMVFFEVLLIYLLIKYPFSETWRYAVCFAGIMLTRPDGFIYAGFIIMGFLLFNVNKQTTFNRINITNITKGIGLAIILFAPWLIISAIYYGTPIPHTIIAKSKSYSLEYFIQAFIDYWKTFNGSPNLFLPSYAVNFGGWGFFKPVAQILSVLSLFYWTLPRTNKLARALSFSSLMMVLYLNIVSGQGASPWYLPSAITPSLIVLTLIFNDVYLASSKFSSLKIVLSIGIMGIGIFMLSNFYFGMRMIKYQQKIVESGNRKQIGLWLKEHANPKDRVFMECLGYIGFYSNLKTYDFPGMSSPEVVQARKKLKSDKYSAVINYLKPEWLVLRAGEATEIKRETPHLMLNEYKLAKTFDVRDEIAKANIKYGEPFLQVDALFEVYQKVGK